MSIKGFSPFVGMDSLRAFNKLNKALFDTRTKRYEGFIDKRGIKYEGTVENFGSEILLEPRKVLLDRLPLDNLFIKDTMSFYFDIRYSGFVNTYNQQNMLCAILKKDAFVSNYSYKIKFNGTNIITIPRSRSSSDPNVIRDRFYVSSTPPTLLIDNNEVELRIDGIEGDTVYYFHIGPDTDDIIDQVFNDYFLTKELDDSMTGYSLMWMCCDVLRTLPDIGLVNNVYESNQLLTIGNNGHDGVGEHYVEYRLETYGGDALVYPYMNGPLGSTDTSQWFIKVRSSDNTAFNDKNPKSLLNYSADISEIHFIRYDEIRDLPNVTPVEDICITYDTEYCKMMLFTENIDESCWSFRRPVEGDYDYDGTEYKNLPYAYTKLDQFIGNYDDTVDILKAAFSIAFDEKYHFKYEELLLNTYSGIHIDNTGDHSDNGVDKKYGVIHELGDFDGLPSYFQYMLNEDLHRAHVELYSIRDKQDDPNQKAYEKQAAGIIIDSAIPKMTSPSIPEGAVPSIKYNAYAENVMEYKFDASAPMIDSKNYLTEMTYTDQDNVGNCNMQSHKNEPKFIYHGNGRFSLTVEDGLDPLTQYGRVYIISNDKAEYVNNTLADLIKAPRTFARICDIPTNFSQLTHIHGYVPTFILDTKYVHTNCDYSEYCRDILYNLRNQSHWLRRRGLYGDIVIPPYEHMDSLYRITYPEYININGKILLDIGIEAGHVITLTPNNTSTYSDGSVIRFYLGGYAINITIHNDGGSITYDVASNIPNDAYMPRSNFDAMEYTVNTELVSGTSSSSATVTISVDNTAWDNAAMKVKVDEKGIVPLDNGFYFKFDSDNDIWVYDYDLDNREFVKSQRLSGEDVYSNSYEDNLHLEESVSDVMLYNELNSNGHDLYTHNIMKYDDETVLSSNADIAHVVNYSDDLNKSLINHQDSYYIIYEDGSYVCKVHIVENCHLYMNDITSLIWPANTDMNLQSYTNKSNIIRMTNKDKVQPSLVVYDPSCDVKYDINEDIKATDLMIISETKNFSYSYILSNDFRTNHFAKGNIYKYDEYDTSNTIDAYYETLSLYSRDSLIEILRSKFKDCSMLNMIDVYSDEDIVNYIVQNTTTYDINGSYYTDNPKSTVYRKNNISLFCKKNDDLNSIKFKGDIVCLTDNRFHESVTIAGDSSYTTTKPVYWFKLDIEPSEITDPEFTEYRIYDENGNDITKYSILIINLEKYVSIVVDSEIKWIKMR